MKMKRSLWAVSVLVLTLIACTPAQGDPATDGAPAVIDHEVKALNGETVNLADYRGKAMLIVNTASRCGFTPQYAGLQELHEAYGERGLIVVGFPSNDFGGQEPGTSEEIASFCQKNYGVSFPMMAKVHAKGDEKAPIYQTLTEQTSDDIRGEVKWNFTKFLVDTDGNVVSRFGSRVKPMSEELTAAVEGVLPK